MPEIKVQHIVSCSCADKNNPAENLLKAEGSHKWKTTGQPKNAVVVLQLEKASQIQSVDVGNEGSAFVEILVGRETATADHDYKVLLVASSFMTPLESRNNTNRNAVRMFGLDKLSNAVSSEKWDRVKIVCTQPFNKSSEYGLSFIKFHSTPTAGDSKKDEGVKKLGAFTIKPEAGDDISSGSMFAKKKTEPAEKPAPTGAAAVRAASRLADESVSSPKVEKQVKITPSPAQNKRKHKDSDEDDKPSTSGTPIPSLKKQSTSLSSTMSTASSNKSDSAPPLKKTKSEPPKESPVKAFGRLMEGVVFAMSGFQNPYRGELRQKAIDMGGVYKPDWGKGCTHLICAFSNTPKYNAVRGKGKIVRKDWILQCYKQKKLLPWKKFRLGDAETPDEDSTEDEEEFVPKKKPVKKADSPPPKKVPSKPKTATKYMNDSDSGEDTEEEVRKVKAKIEKGKTTPKKTADDDIYNASTDEDQPSTSKKISPKKESPVKNGDDGSDSGFPELPDFFRKKIFLLYGELNEKTKRSMIRYITAYDGELEEYMSDKVQFVVTNSEWDQNFDDALSDNPSLIFVKPIWVAKCHDKSKFVPYQPYVVVPSESD